MERVRLVPNESQNYPRSDWMCWTCRQVIQVLGSRGEERCATCDTPMERLSGLLVASDAGERDGS